MKDNIGDLICFSMLQHCIIIIILLFVMWCKSFKVSQTETMIVFAKNRQTLLVLNILSSIKGYLQQPSQAVELPSGDGDGTGFSLVNFAENKKYTLVSHAKW